MILTLIYRTGVYKMFKWYRKKIIEQQKIETFEKLKPAFFMLLNLYHNTWDKNLVKQLLSVLSTIDEKRFYNDKDVCNIVHKIMSEHEE